MALMIGQQLGSYEVTALLGKGGMGEVYRARDTKLKRDVAIKILPEEFSRDAERVNRFQREAELLATLNHPNIASIYDVQESNGTRFLVLELIEGDTLADVLHKRGALSVEEALQTARQVCDGLEAAHEKSVVHRDLKPANLKVTPDGKVKILDFGLAKARETAAANANTSNSPTMSLAGTVPGVILGTAGYMSPEQAKGLEATAQSDIFSFGCILYEALTGRRAFDGDTLSETLASVLKSEVDLGVLPARIHPKIEELLRRCLEKNLKQRWHSAADVRVEIESLLSAGAFVEKPPAAPAQPLWKRAIPVTLGLLAGAALAGTAAWTLKVQPERPAIRTAILVEELQTADLANYQSLTISADGSRVVFGTDNGESFLRSMSESQPRKIIGQSRNPVFSPDGQSIAYWASDERTLKKISINGGLPTTLCPLEGPRGLSWTEDGIVFGAQGKGILRASANGGEPEVLVALKGGEILSQPHLLPGGRAVLFTVNSSGNREFQSWDTAKVVVQALPTGERKTLIEGGSDARYLRSGHIIFAFSGTLRAVTFDLGRLEVTSGAVPVLEGVRRAVNDGGAQYAVSDSGSLIYVPGPVTATLNQHDLALFDRKGMMEFLKLPPGPKGVPRFSPDGRHIAFESSSSQETFVLIYDVAGNSVPRRLTFGGKNRFPIWSHDGQRIAFQSDREGDLGIYWQRAYGTGTAERLTKAEMDTAHTPESWAPGGEGFLFDMVKGATHSLWFYSLRDKKAAPFGAVQSAIPPNAVFSPNGKWVAYASDETGKREVYVQPFPSTGDKYQVLSPGAINPHHPLWSPDGKELFYIPTAAQALAVPFITQPVVSFGKAEAITSEVDSGGPQTKRNTDVGPDGRFVRVYAADRGNPAPGAGRGAIHVVINWFEELKQLAPVP